MWKKEILARAYQNPKRKLGVTTNFSEIIDLKFGKKSPYTLRFFRIMVAEQLSLKNAWLLTFFFLGSNHPY